jgi:uncharacterized membrane protein
MQRITKKQILALAIITIAIAYFMLFSKDEENLEIQSATNVSENNQQQLNQIVSQQIAFQGELIDVELQ